MCKHCIKVSSVTTFWVPTFSLLSVWQRWFSKLNFSSLSDLNMFVTDGAASAAGRRSRFRQVRRGVELWMRFCWFWYRRRSRCFDVLSCSFCDVVIVRRLVLLVVMLRSCCPSLPRMWCSPFVWFYFCHGFGSPPRSLSFFVPPLCSLAVALGGLFLLFTTIAFIPVVIRCICLILPFGPTKFFLLWRVCPCLCVVFQIGLSSY